MGNNYKMVAKTLFGFEDLLAEELTTLGALRVVKGTRMVSFEGDEGMMYKANLACRTAIKILKPIHSFPVRNEAMLYKAIYKMKWDDYLDIDKTFAVDATVFSDYFNHSKYVALKTKDAIVDAFRDKYGKRPDVELDHPDLQINIHIHQDYCTVSLDSSGDSLHRRGYRFRTGMAPISEVLAAGLLMLSGWRGQSDFLDPMCGSGTILVEAAMIACNIPPNIHRKEFAFERWPDYDNALFEKIRDVLLAKTHEFSYKITGYEIDKKVAEMARENIIDAGLEDYIEIKEQNFFISDKEGMGPLHLLFNPPYDERLEIDTNIFYEDIGNTLKQGYPNTNAWMLTANLPALKRVGLRPSKKIICYNGALEARLVKYEMYEGSKKNKN